MDTQWKELDFFPEVKKIFKENNKQLPEVWKRLSHLKRQQVSFAPDGRVNSLKLEVTWSEVSTQRIFLKIEQPHNEADRLRQICAQRKDAVGE